MKPICIPCERFMRPLQNGYRFIEGMPTVEGGGVGKDATGWLPYKVWIGDLWGCPTCKAQSVNGVAMAPVSEHYMRDFADYLATASDGVFVKDC